LLLECPAAGDAPFGGRFWIPLHASPFCRALAARNPAERRPTGVTRGTTADFGLIAARATVGTPGPRPPSSPSPSLSPFPCASATHFVKKSHQSKECRSRVTVFCDRGKELEVRNGWKWGKGLGMGLGIGNGNGAGAGVGD
jgi:hypothetical protein